MGKVIEYKDDVSNVRLVDLGDEFEVVLSGNPSIAAGATVTDQDLARGLQVASNILQAADPDAIKTAFSTSTGPVTYSGSDLDGAMIAAVRACSPAAL